MDDLVKRVAELEAEQQVLRERLDLMEPLVAQMAASLQAAAGALTAVGVTVRTLQE